MKKTFNTLLSLLLITSICPQIQSASTTLWQSNLSFGQLIQKNEFVVVKFWMPGCRPCKKLSPIFESASETKFQKNVLFLNINVHEYPKVAERYAIKSVPQILYIKSGKTAGKLVGGKISLAEITTKAHELFDI